MENKINIGDYVTLNKLEEKVIYEVLTLDENINKIILKVVFPRELAKQLKETNVFSLNIPYNKIKLLGNPSNLPSLRVLYGK